MAAGPGTNQVQSIADCSPNDDGHERQRHERGPLGVQSRRGAGLPSRPRRRRRGYSPVARAADASQAISSATDSAPPTSPRSASVWTPIAVRVARHRVVGAVAQAGDLEGARARRP